MSYKLTQISLYGVELSFQLARQIHFEICESVYPKEKAVGFPAVLEEWHTDEFQLSEYYDALQEEKAIDTLFSSETDIRKFFKSCSFSERQADTVDVEKIPSHFDKTRDKHYYRYRYFINFFLKGGDTRSEIRFEEEGTTVYGVYIASNGYAYEDDLAQFNEEGKSRYVHNFNKYCKPLLEKYGIHAVPALIEIEQTW